MIKGYRNLTKEEINLINAIKEKGEEIESLCEILKKNSFCDQRWVSIGVTDLQTGFMALVRSVANPESF